MPARNSFYKAKNKIDGFLSIADTLWQKIVARVDSNRATMNPGTLLNLSYLFSVKPIIVFEAWTKPEAMRSWLFKSPNNEILSIRPDLKGGGKFSILELHKDEKIDHFGEF